MSIASQKNYTAAYCHYTNNSIVDNVICSPMNYFESQSMFGADQYSRVFCGMVGQQEYYCGTSSGGSSYRGASNSYPDEMNDFIATNSVYTATTLYNKKPCMYIPIKKVSEVVPPYPSGFFYFIDASANIGNAQNPATKLGAGFTATDFHTTFDDFYMIDPATVLSGRIYDNDKDGKISASAPRAVFGNSSNPADVFCRCSYTKINNITGKGDILFPVMKGLFGNGLTMGNSTLQRGGHPLFYNNMSGFVGLINTPTSVAGGTQTTEITCKWFYVFKKEALTYYLNQIGIPWSTDLNEVLYKNSSEFALFKPSGQDVNTTGGGNGAGDNTSDTINGVTPSLTPINTFNAQYAMSQNMLNGLGSYLWTSTFVDDVKLLFNNPAEGVISCRMFPFSLPDHDSAHVGASTPIIIGNVTTTVSGQPITSGYNCMFDLGSITVSEYYGHAMDYEPYTNIQIYLPYIGIKDLSTNEVMNKTISVKYIIDITTGSAIAEILVDGNVLYTYDGKIGIDIPISSTNASQYAMNLAMTGASAVAGIAVGAATANPLAIAGTVLATAKSVASNQMHINKGGANSPMSAMFLPQNCYLIYNRPVQSLASSFGATHGFPCNVTKLLSSVTGYTEIESPILNSIPATEEEKNQIKNLLETGVIFA